MQGSLHRAQPIPQRERWLAYISLISIASVWGATFFMVKDATSKFPVLGFLAIRFGLGALALLPFVIRARRKPSRRELVLGSLAGITFFAGYVFQTFALRLSDSGRVGFITGLYVVLVPILAWIILRHRPTPRVIVGAALALVGLTLLSYAPGGNLVGDLLAFLCALSFASQILIVEKFPRDADWRTVSFLQASWVAVSALILLPVQAVINACAAPVCAFFAPLTEPLPASVPGEVWVTVLVVAAFTGLVATALGLGLQVWAQKRLSPTDTALIFATESPFSALFGWLARGETMTFSALVGCGMIMSGMLTTTLSNPPAVALEALEAIPPGFAGDPSTASSPD